jgi:hypothetical protein
MLFEVNSTTIFHVLRHFDGYSENLLKYLEGEEYYYYDYELKSMQKSVITKSKMKQAIQTIGSKFYHQRIDIFDLMNSIQIELEERRLDWKVEGGVKKVDFIYSFEGVVGFSNLVKKSDLDDSLKGSIITVPRSSLEGENSVMVDVLNSQDISLQQTSKIGVEIVRTPELPFYWFTAYPTIDDDQDIDFDDYVMVVNE